MWQCMEPLPHLPDALCISPVIVVKRKNLRLSTHLLEMSPFGGGNSGPQPVGGEILDQCADERNENDPSPISYQHHRASVLSLCKTIGADVQLRDFFPQDEDRSN
jgi:hypothetical protein